MNARAAVTQPLGLFICYLPDLPRLSFYGIVAKFQNFKLSLWVFEYLRFNT